MGYVKYLAMALCILILACQSVKVPIQHMQAAQQKIPDDVQTIAIFPYEGNIEPEWMSLKETIPDQVSNEITSYGTYRVVERANVQSLVREAILSKGTIMEPSDLEEAGRVAQAQAIVVGKVNSVNVQEQMLQKQVQVPTYDPRMPPQMRFFPYKVLRVTLSVTSYMLHVRDKTQIVTDTFNHTYDSERDPDVGRKLFEDDASFYQSQPARIPSVAQVLSKLAQRCANQFIQKISAHPVKFSVDLMSGGTPAMEAGIQWAENGQYSRAADEFMKATNDPEEGYAAWYNLGVCYEAEKRYSDALQAYERSNQMKRTSEAIESIARIQKYGK